MNLRKSLLSAVAATSVSVFAVGASAQAPDAAQQQAQPVSEQEVKQFAKAEQKVAKISEEWAPRVQSAGSNEEAEQLAQQAQGQMVEAIEGEGLTVQRYNEIYAQAQMDADLADRIRSAA